MTRLLRVVVAVSLLSLACLAATIVLLLTSQRQLAERVDCLVLLNQMQVEDRADFDC